MSLMSETCVPHHDYAANVFTAFLCVGLVVSYLPQHLRIPKAGSSEGFSPWFLLLGSTSSAAGMLNIIVLQWDIIECCRVLSIGSCAESVAGIFQLSLQWFLFTVILVQYIIYFPSHLKYSDVDVGLQDSDHTQQLKTSVRSYQWGLSIVLSWVVFIHLALISFITFLLLSTDPSPDTSRRATQISVWATFLGVSSAVLAAMQYAPQLIHTYRLRLVGAISIPTMLIQSPGAVLMVLSIALRPGTNWTTWLTYAVAGVMQFSLLVMCLFWKARQRRLGIDDFGNLLSPPSTHDGETELQMPAVQGLEEGISVNTVIDDAVQTDLGSQTDTNEETPLLAKGTVQAGRSGGTWFSWYRR